MPASLCVLALVALQSPAPRPELAALNPVQVSDGPLLIFTRPQNPTGDAWCVGYEGPLNAVYVFDPITEDEPQLLHLPATRRSSHPIEFLARPTRELCIVKQGFETDLLELRTGQRSPPLDADTITEFVATRGSNVFFLERPPREESPIALYVRDVADTAGSRRLVELEFESFLRRNSVGCLLVTASGRRRIVQVHWSGAVEEIAEFEARWDPNWVQLVPSPKGERLAIVGMRYQQYVGPRDVVVIDRAKRRVLHSSEQTPPPPPEFLRKYSGTPSSLHLEWASESELLERTSERVQILDVTTNSVTFAAPSFAVDLTPPSSDLFLDGFNTGELRGWLANEQPTSEWFEWDIGELRYRGEEALIEDLDPNTFGPHISPDGRFAAFESEKPAALRVIDGKLRKVHTVVQGEVYNLTWLAAPAK